jgi:hypothetical protein
MCLRMEGDVEIWTFALCPGGTASSLGDGQVLRYLQSVNGRGTILKKAIGEVPESSGPSPLSRTGALPGRRQGLA